jgi:acetyl esterase/lipase
VLFNPVFNNGPGEYGNQSVGDRVKEFSPAHQEMKNAPPTIVFLGDKDNLIPVSTVKNYEAAMLKAGAKCTAHIYPGAEHGFFNRDPHFTQTLIETDKFLAALGWIEGPPTLKASEK